MYVKKEGISRSISDIFFKMGGSNLNNKYAEQTEAASKHLSKRDAGRSRTFGSLRYLP